MERHLLIQILRNQLSDMLVCRNLILSRPGMAVEGELENYNLRIPQTQVLLNQFDPPHPEF